MPHSYPTPNHTLRIRRTQTALLIIDIQQRLLPAIHEKERVLQNTLRLAQAATCLRLPIFVTEQYPKGIGHTVPEIANTLPQVQPIEKLAFSACGAPSLLDQFNRFSTQFVVTCGIESHVCVCQTTLDLLQHRFTPVIVADAISSRTPANHACGLDRMRQAGAIIVSTEMILFELLESAGTPDFKKILSLLK